MAIYKLTLTNQISPPAADGIYVAQAMNVNDTSKRITLELVLTTGAGEHPRHFAVTVANGEADALVPNPQPTYTDLLIVQHRTALDYPDLANAFDQVMFAYSQQLNTGAILSTLLSLGLLPAGVVAQVQ